MVIRAHKPKYTDANRYWTVMRLYLPQVCPEFNPHCHGRFWVFTCRDCGDTDFCGHDGGFRCFSHILKGLSWALALEWLGMTSVHGRSHPMVFLTCSQLLHYSPIEQKKHWLRKAHLRSFTVSDMHHLSDISITIFLNPIYKTVKGRNLNGENSPTTILCRAWNP